MKKIVILGLCVSMLFTGCGETSLIEDVNTDTVENTVDDTVENVKEENISYAIVDNYQGEQDNVSFDMEIVIPSNMSESLIEGTASLMKVDIKPVFELLLDGDVEKYPMEEGEMENEFKEMVNCSSYFLLSEDGFVALRKSSISSGFDYSNSKMTEYWSQVIDLDKEYDSYNADVYSTTEELEFQSREDAWKEVENVLTTSGLQAQYTYTGYALDYETMAEEEYAMGMDGQEDTSVYKDSWSKEDECYFFAARQTYQEIPIYHIFVEVFKGVNDFNAPIQAYVSPNGLEKLDVERIYDITADKNVEEIATMEQVAEVVAEKMNRILNTEYHFSSAELFYYVDLFSGVGTYDMKPVWVIRGTQIGDGESSELELIIDAQTLKFY